MDRLTAMRVFLKLHPQLKVDPDASEGALNLVEACIDLAIRISAEQVVPQTPEDLTIQRCLSYANFGKSVWQLHQGEEQVRVSQCGQSLQRQ